MDKRSYAELERRLKELEQLLQSKAYSRNFKFATKDLICFRGSGIPEENIAYLFDPFFTTKEDGQGTGLGLSIVYGVIKNHKDNIQINSKVGAGSSFILDFPLI